MGEWERRSSDTEIVRTDALSPLPFICKFSLSLAADCTKHKQELGKLDIPEGKNRITPKWIQNRELRHAWDSAPNETQKQSTQPKAAFSCTDRALFGCIELKNRQLSIQYNLIKYYRL